jgi:hypothetical protein
MIKSVLTTIATNSLLTLGLKQVARLKREGILACAVNAETFRKQGLREVSIYNMPFIVRKVLTGTAGSMCGADEGCVLRARIHTR